MRSDPATASDVRPVGDGGPAFPFVQWRTPDGMTGFQQTDGMSLRDYFAGKAMSQGMAVLVASQHNLNEHQLKMLARTAYLAADAMLATRQEPRHDR